MDEKKTNAESSEEFDKQMKAFGQAAGEMFGALAEGMTAFMGGFAESVGKTFESVETGFNASFEGSLNGRKMDLLGTWSCPELRQSVTLAVFDANFVVGGKEIWRGDWEEREEDGLRTVYPKADTLGGYGHFEVQKDEDGRLYLAGILSDTGTEKQFVRFVKEQC